MRNFKLTIAYDGTSYHGWQTQPGLITIQGIMEDTLAKIIGHKVVVCGAGRTDAGVHAKGQVAHFHADTNHSLEILARALNATLPSDIAIIKIEEVPSSFHAQFDALGKEYRYYIFNQPVRSPFVGKSSLWVSTGLDVEAMREALSLMVGTHDFYSLSVVSEEKKNTIRTISRAEIKSEGDYLLVIIEGDGFLHKMVRRIVGTLLAIGKHKISSDRIPKILQSHNKQLGGKSVPGQGLFLMSVKYGQ